MSDRMRLGAIALVALIAPLTSPAPADAKVAYPPFCRMSTKLVGTPSGGALPTILAGGFPETRTRVEGFRVEARDVINAPKAYCQVTLDFSETTVRLLNDDRAGVTVNCAARTISVLTDVDGVATFYPRFCGNTAGTGVLVHVEGVILGRLDACSTDIDGDGHTGLSDLARFAQSFQGNAADPATDFDTCSEGSVGRTTLSDFVILARELMNGSPAAVACP